MGFDITTIIEQTIKDLIKGKWGDNLAALYKKHFALFNFTIIYAIGLLLYIITSPIFANLLGWFGAIFSFLISATWVYTMTVGILGSIWGYNKKETKEKLEVKVTES